MRDNGCEQLFISYNVYSCKIIELTSTQDIDGCVNNMDL